MPSLLSSSRINAIGCLPIDIPVFFRSASTSSRPSIRVRNGVSERTTPSADHPADEASAPLLKPGEELNPATPSDQGREFNGLFYEPTVITGATNDMRPMQEETFGPTLPIATFKTEEEAIRLANDSEFGLTASVWTKDNAKGKRVASRLEAGSVCVNEVLYTHGIGQTPWGGFKKA
jgi:acyl-CoA reductase-like NAD-dependent aldehyde dehydrogenase